MKGGNAMNKKKLLILIVLSVFVVGMVMGAASAGHTFKDKGYKYKMGTKKFKSMKKYAKKTGHDSVHVKVSKTKYWTSIEKLKIGKTYKMTTGDKIKVLKLVKKYKGSKYGGGGYKYKVKKYAHMNCEVDYYKGKFSYYAVAY